MTSFFVGFFHTDIGVTCSEGGFNDLSTAQECSATVSYAKNFNNRAHYYGEISLSEGAKGCVMSKHPVGTIYFNSHPTGGRNLTGFISICKNGNKEFWVHYSALGK